MTILQAYELAKAGKTVISPLGTEWRQSDFEAPHSLALHHVTGEWREPRVIWVNEYQDALNKLWCESKEQADANADTDRIACVKFIEACE